MFFMGSVMNSQKAFKKQQQKTVVTIHDLIFIRYLIFLKALTKNILSQSLNTHVKLQITLL